MKRSMVVTASTIAGVWSVLALNPTGATATSVVIAANPAPADVASPTTDGATSDPNPSASTTATAVTATTNVVKGTAVDTQYGLVQVQVSFKGAAITRIEALALPDNERRSQQISSTAFPMLVRQALKAQSAQIDGVSGASFTTQGFTQSLQSAIAGTTP